MSTSRERFMQQLERCVRHQPDGIEPGPTIRSEEPELYAGAGEFIPSEEIVNAPFVQCDTESVWGLRPPGEEPPPAAPIYIGDWA